MVLPGIKTSAGRIKNKYVWMCAHYYLCELEEYDFPVSRKTLEACMNWQIEELAYKGYAGRDRNRKWFDKMMGLCDR